MMNGENENTANGKESLSFSLSKTIKYLEQNKLVDILDEINSINPDVDAKKQRSIKKGLILFGLEQHSLFEDFAKLLWPNYKRSDNVERYNRYKKKYIEYKKSYPSILKNTKEINSKVDNTMNKKTDAPLNQILYGPPGTGKTYNTIIKAAQIINNNNTIRDYSTAKNIFNEHLHDRIEFITFHQNYSYEDFIQGLRPDVAVKGQLQFEKTDGVFKRIATNALFEYFKLSKQKTGKRIIDINEVYLDFVEFMKSKIGTEFKTSKGSIVSVNDISINNNINFKPKISNRTYTVSAQRLLTLFNKYPDISKIDSIHETIRDVIGGCNATIYWVALREFIEFHKNYTNTETSEDDYDDISYETKKQLLSTCDFNSLLNVNSKNVPNYVLIIDEINRANISRVFGELITLIEPDKRSHGAIPLSCTLPSGETFIVPSNLYIIGTMNTADKSIALLDVALRRRFEFVPMYPDYTVETLQEKEILKKINDAIIKSKGNGNGYDFQIGHSYFMGEDFNLVAVINKKVIPLLLEYFMNNIDEVKEILKEAGLKINDRSIWPLSITENK